MRKLTEREKEKIFGYDLLDPNDIAEVKTNDAGTEFVEVTYAVDENGREHKYKLVPLSREGQFLLIEGRNRKQINIFDS